ncbi:MAG: aminotransferase class I/II-fold pyridoxal phosphate-dependent enzyme, partial [Vulcanimicrobiaceae bacterium]
YAGTASKTIAPGMRVAWLAVPAGPLFEKAVLAKQGADLHTSTFSQRAIYEYVRAPGRFAGHVDSMIPVYRRRRDLMLATLAEAMPPGWSWTKPDGGLFLWLRGPESIDTTKLLERAVARKVAFVPGAAFWVGTDIRNTLRLNFSNASDEKIVDGIRRFAEVAAAN